MKRVWQTSAKVLVGFFVAAMYAMPQAYTVSARPGAINYIEGHAAVNGSEISQKTVGKTFLNTNDTLSTDVGKAEVLLTPGVFLRIGDNTQIKMVSPSLTNTQVEVMKGEAMVEVAQLVKDNDIQLLDHGASMRLEKDGLYRVTADDPPTAAVIEGKATVNLGDRKVDLGKGHEAVLTADLKTQKFDTKKEDDLYAWSNVRSEYDAGSSYAAAKNVTINNYGGYGAFGYPFAGFYGPGWYWNGLWDSWAWLPYNSYFFSPFGWGFYSPGYLAYAPIVYVPVNGRQVPVAVSTKNPPAIGTKTAAVRSPAALQAARAQTARTFARGEGVSRPAATSRMGSFSAPPPPPAPVSRSTRH
ncbi:MAG: FecR domain-containing protein [Acidobacteriaceae bacterium]|nr:FecR domain-containing protein [Acidobacteriaceae bacterium]